MSQAQHEVGTWSMWSFTCASIGSLCIKPKEEHIEMVQARPLSAVRTSRKQDVEQFEEALEAKSTSISQEELQLESVKLTYGDGSTYIGDFLHGKRHGVGSLSSTDSDYIGEWKSDQQDGWGQQFWIDGRVYRGQYSNGCFHGDGCMEWSTPQGWMKYEGQYVNDAKHGRGRFSWSDGRAYDGMWISGKRSGTGTYINREGVLRHGRWENDKLVSWIDIANQPDCEEIKDTPCPAPTYVEWRFNDVGGHGYPAESLTKYESKAFCTVPAPVFFFIGDDSVVQSAGRKDEVGADRIDRDDGLVSMRANDQIQGA